MFTAGKPVSLGDVAQALLPTPAHDSVSQCRRVFLISGTLRVLWGRQFCLQPPFRRLLAAVRYRQAPAKSRLQPGLAAPQFAQTPWQNFSASGTIACATSSVNNAG